MNYQSSSGRTHGCPTTATSSCSAPSSPRRRRTRSRSWRSRRPASSAGFDLVTFQDHPYQPAFLDTWTLLSWVAASDRAHARRRQRAQPAAAPARRPGPRGREPRPALRRPVRARPRRRRVLGRDRRDGRRRADARAGRRRARRGDRRDPRHLGRRRPRRPLRVDGELPPRRRRQARPGARARHPDLARRVQAAHAAAWSAARPTAGCRSLGYLQPGDLARRQRHDRRRRARPPGGTRARSGGC